MIKRFNKAKKSFDKPVMIVTQAEAELAEKGFSKEKRHGTLSLKMLEILHLHHLENLFGT